MPPVHRSERYRGRIWRMVEAQHVVSTLALVDTLEEQSVLEAILERSKPEVPAACRHLHYLLAAPFRYGRYPTDSRFRRRGRTPGVFYGAEHALTAAMESAWYRLKFIAAAPGMVQPQGAAEYTGFAVEVATGALDLCVPPRDRDPALWGDPEDYAGCLALADAARAAGVGAIRYRSLRDPEARANLAVLRCDAFATPEPMDRETWRIALRAGGAVIVRDWPRAAWEVRREGSRLALK
ncbi:MAG TPA: RES domain-containing protein [Aliiroseovarius sp.]|nr:RES domain-containing protein [Aliiroseovarius sp.]